MDRRLAVILAADVAGYSALMERDETRTFERLRDIRKELFEPLIERHHGHIFKLTGDGLLVEFSSVVEAVECAAALQTGLAERERSSPEIERIKVRIGINLGEVIVDGDDRYGEGVNVAARLEQLAPPGGIHVSGKVAKEVEKKLAFGLEPMGEQKLKNLIEPVAVYRVKLDGTASSRSGSPRGTTLPNPRRWRAALIGAAALLLAMAAGAGLWLRPWEPKFEPDLPLPDKPSVAVLPFTNMSADPQQGYFADGMTDNLITDLSKIPGLFVISRNSTFAYKDKPVDPRQTAKELGVRYVLEGSVQRSADEVRINAQLIDAVNNGHVWADRFDGSVTDVFALQDRVTRSIADALALRLTTTLASEVGKSETENLEAYDAFLHGMEHLRRRTPDEFSKAIPFLEQAIKLDPNYGRAYASLAWIYAVSYQRKWFDVLQISDVEARIKAKQYLKEAQKNPTSMSHQVAGQMWAASDNSSNAIAEFKEAIVLDPGDAVSYISLADSLTFASRPSEALPLIRTAMRLDPRHPPYFYTSLGMAQYRQQQFEEALASFDRTARLDPDDTTPLLWLAATYGQLGRKEEALAVVSRYNQLAVKRGGIPATVNGVTPRVREGLALAGVPKTLSEFAADNQLDASEARQLFLGHRLRGRTIWTGNKHEAEIAADGRATLTGDWATYPTGTVTFENNQVCLIWSQGPKSCGNVSRNPGGTKSAENEFIWLIDPEGMTFSAAE
jgi:adenylate cyclase